jgi:hypothetical protein
MTDTSGPLSLDERIAAARREAERSTGQVTGFGENLVDRLLGGVSAGGYGIMGGVTDLAGNLGAFLGGPFSKDAATLEMFSDEAYRRALPLLLEGYSEGSKTAAEDALPMFLFEEKAMREAEAAKQQDPLFLGEFGDIAMPSEIDPKAASEQFGDVEFQMDDIAKDLAALGPVSRKMDADAKAAVESKPTISDPTVKSKTEQMSAEAFRAREAQMAGKIGTTALDKAFVAALQDVEEARGDTPPKGESREDALARYKKEFEEATGIDASGKVDKSKALMAFGLALMQNKAGRGFNVGKMLASVGEAGQAAMPALEKAEERASAAKLAAGKYALQQIKADEDASAAVAASNLAHRRAIELENLKTLNKIIEKTEEAKLEGKEFKMPESIYNSKIEIGGKTLEIRKGLSPTTGRPIYVDATGDAKKVAQAYNRTMDGLNSINQMRSILGLMEEAKNNPGGIAADRFLDRAKGVLSSMGIGDADAFFTDIDRLVESGELPEEFRGMSLETSTDTIRKALLLRFKRFMSQETGNGISNVDFEALNAASGKLGLFENINNARGALAELEILFTDSLDVLDPLITDMANPKNYLTFGQENNYLHREALEALNESLSKSIGGYTIMPQTVDGQQIYDVRDRK